MNIIEKLKSSGVEITPELEKTFGGEWISQMEHEKKVSKAETETGKYKKQAEDAAELLKTLDGKSIEDITKERDQWKTKAETAEREYNEKLTEREKKDLLAEAVKDIKFSSESARKSILADIEASVTVKDGKLIGFNDLINEAKEKDKSAFIDDADDQAQKNRPRFTQQLNNQGNQQLKDGITKDDIMKIKDPVERQAKIRENIGLFQKG